MTSFEVKITNTKKGIRAAQRLRVDVFNRELPKGLRASHELGLDSDPFGSGRGEETLDQSLKRIFGVRERKEPQANGWQ